MKLIHLSLIAALPLVALASQAHAQERGDKIANSYICVFKASAVSRGNAQAEANRSVKAGGGQLKHVYSAALRGFAANMSAQGIENAKHNNPNIAYCEQDQIVTTGQVRAEAPPGRRRQRPAGAGQPRGASPASAAAPPAPSPRHG